MWNRHCLYKMNFWWFLYISGFSGETGRPRFFHIIPLQNGLLHLWRLSLFQVAILLTCVLMPGSPFCRGQRLWKSQECTKKKGGWVPWFCREDALLHLWQVPDFVEVWGPKSQVWLYKMGTPNPPRSFFGGIQKYCACHAKRLSTRSRTRLNVTKCHACHAKRSNQTSETSKKNHLCKTSHRHGHTVLTRTVADGCGRGSNVERTHPQPPDPQSETGTLATHSGKTSISCETSANVDIFHMLSNRLECHKVPCLPRKTTWQPAWKHSKRTGFPASPIDTATPQENERLATRHVGAEKPACPTRLPPILKFCEHHQTGWNVRKCHVCHAKQQHSLPGNIRKGQVFQLPP